MSRDKPWNLVMTLDLHGLVGTGDDDRGHWFGTLSSGLKIPQECVGCACALGSNCATCGSTDTGVLDIGVPVTMGDCATRDPVATK